MEVNTQDLYALGRLKGSDLTVVELSYSYIYDLGIQDLCKGSPNLKRLCLRSNNGGFQLEFADATVQSIITNCPKIETLSLDGWLGLTTQSLIYLAKLQFLREISLDDCDQLTSVAVQALLRANQRLETLILCEDSDLSSYTAPTYIDSALLTSIGTNCTELIKLHLKLPETSDVTNATLTDMFRGCSLLEELRFAEFRKPNTLLPTLGA